MTILAAGPPDNATVVVTVATQDLSAGVAVGVLLSGVFIAFG